MGIIGCTVAQILKWAPELRGVHGGALGGEQEYCMLLLYLFAVNLSSSLAMEPPFRAHPVVTGAEMQQKPQNWETVELLHRQTLKFQEETKAGIEETAYSAC